jgi:ribosomal protein S18 acetylase RimI-like enzyme
MEIKSIKSLKKLKEYYNFVTRVFYDDAVQYKEHYYPMYNFHDKLMEQYEKDKSLILYLEDKGEMVGTICIKDMKDDECTIDAVAVRKDYRKKGYATILIKEMESRLKKKKIKKISLGARLRASKLYLDNGYTPQLLIQVNDFANTDMIKKANVYDFKILNEYQNDVCGAVFFEVKDIKKSVISHFEKEVPTAHAMYIFTKEI